MIPRCGRALRQVAAARPSPAPSAWFAACGLVVAAGGLAQAPEETGSGLAGPVGRVSFLVAPVDATIRVGHLEFESLPPPLTDRPQPESSPAAPTLVDGPSAPATLPAGEWLAEISRPGYRTAFVGFTVNAGENAEVEVRLRRESAVLRLRTAPADAIVLVDGYERGRTTRAAASGFVSEGDGAGRPARFSRELWIDDLPAGSWRVDVRKEGFRAFSTRLDAHGLSDVELPSVVLEPERGVVGLKGLPEDAEVLANGRELEPDRQTWPPEILLPPGSHRITVRRGIHGWFETSVSVEDGDRTEVDVELRPALAFLGVFGGDEAGRRAVASTVEVLREETAYMVLDRSAEGAALLDELDLDPAVLRSRAASARLELDWKTIQRRFRERLPAALYLVAVLNDDLVSEAADLWLWAPAPGPARPDVRSLPIGNGRLKAGPLWRLLAALEPEPAVRSRRVGAVVIESIAGDALTVAAVEPGSPAAAAGLRPGMEILSIGGREASAFELSAALAELVPGSAVELDVLTKDGAAAVSLSAAWSWRPVNPFDQELLLAAAASRRLRELETTTGPAVPRWLLELDLATLLLGTGEAAEAARRLEAIDVSSLEETHVELVQRALGLAFVSLAEAGQAAFRQRARGIFEELASSRPGRLAAMRARLRASALTGTNDE